MMEKEDILQTIKHKTALIKRDDVASFVRRFKQYVMNSIKVRCSTRKTNFKLDASQKENRKPDLGLYFERSPSTSFLFRLRNQ